MLMAKMFTEKLPITEIGSRTSVVSPLLFESHHFINQLFPVTYFNSKSLDQRFCALSFYKLTAFLDDGHSLVHCTEDFTMKSCD